MHTMEYSNNKKEGTVDTAWVNLTRSVLSDRSHTRKAAQKKKRRKMEGSRIIAKTGHVTFREVHVLV